MSSSSLYAPAEAAEQFLDDTESLWQVPVVTVWKDGPPTALEFLRDYVAANRPCLIQMDDWPRLTVNDLMRMSMQHGNDTGQYLMVDVSPDGHADALRQCQVDNQNNHNNHDNNDNDNDNNNTTTTTTMFVKPQTIRVTWAQFQRQLERQRQKQSVPMTKTATFPTPPDGVFSVVTTPGDEATASCDNDDDDCEGAANDQVYYYSRQDDCLRHELGPLWQSLLEQTSLPASLPWAFPTPPQAINLWMGNEASVSSWHSDPYENLYYVASGEKVLDVAPPAVAPCCRPTREYASGTFVRRPCQLDGGTTTSWKVRADDDDDKVRWAVPPHKGKLLRIHVPAGHLLYLPALWYHQVTQTTETVAINYWYDMNYHGPLWTYSQFIRQLRPLVEDDK